MKTAYDYLNRLTALRTTGDAATTTYAYDFQGNRISQTTSSTTTLYPDKYYSLIQTTSGATTTATSTLYTSRYDRYSTNYNRCHHDSRDFYHTVYSCG